MIATLPVVFLAGLSSLLTSSFLDPSFGTEGIVTTGVGGNVYGASMVLQPDGKIVVAGGSGIVRYTMTGTLDSSFGTQGVALATTGKIARQSDGKFVVVGSQPVVLDFYMMWLGRYTITGTEDTEFGTNGVVTTVVGWSSMASSVVVQPDGKIVVAGGTGWRSSKIAIVRYNSNGSLDMNFGVSGTLVIDLGRYDYATALTLQPDGKIVAAGNSSERMVVVRSTVSGTLDTSFNSTGIVTTSLPGSYPRIWAVALQSSGKIVAVGEDGASEDNTLLARYTTTGTLDTGFGVGGIVTTSIDSGTDRATSVAVQSDDKIVIGGVGYDGNRPNFAAARYLPSGSLDAGFGSGGIVTSSIGLSESTGSSVAVQPDGKVLLAGYSSNDDIKHDLAVVRYVASIYTSFVYLPVVLK